VKVDALVLLGCRVESLDRLSAPARRRAERAAAAYHDARPRWVIASGGRRWNGVHEADALGQALTALGVEERVILRERESLTTRENARYSARLLRERGVREVGVVTCDWHLERALCCFRLEGIEATGIPAASPPVSRLKHQLRSFRERLALRLEGPVASAITRAWRSS
jgi:uncharacterized SAM-binding protein YcdF (DUF218 family)